jgi:site-specific recombinase XerD
VRAKLGLTDAVQEFLLYLAVAGRAQSTMESYTRSLNRFIIALGNIEVQSISSEQLVKVIAGLKFFQINGGKRSPVTMNGIKSAIRSFFKWAYETGRCPENPSLFLRISRSISARTEPITAQETENFFRTIRTSSDRNRLRDEGDVCLYGDSPYRGAQANPGGR